MNDRKLNRLFAAARKAVPPAPSADFATRVLALIRGQRRDAEAMEPFALSLWDQLGALLPRLAVGAALVIGLCVTVDIFSTRHSATLADGVAQLTDQWLFTVDEE